MDNNKIFSVSNLLTGSGSYTRNPAYNPSDVNSNFRVDRSQLTALNPVDQKIEQYSGSNKLSSLFGSAASPAWQNAFSGFKMGADGKLQAPAQRPQQGGQTAAPTASPAAYSAPAYTAPAPRAAGGGQAGSAPAYDPSVTGQPVDPNRLSPDELKDLATRAGQAGLSLSDYTELVNKNSQLGSEDSQAIRDKLGVEEQKNKVFSAPKESLEDVYRNIYKEVGLKDIKTEIAKIDETLNQKRADFNKVEGEIKNNPWLSSSSRRGRLANAAELALNDINNDLTARQQYLDLYTQGVGEVESRLGYIISDRNLEREIDTEQLNYLLNEAERQEGLQVSDNMTAGLRNVPDFIEGRRGEQMRIESNERAAAQAKIASSAVEMPVLRIDEAGNVVAGTEPPKAPNSTEQGTLLFFQRMAEAVQNLDDVEEEISNQGFIGQARMKLFDAPLLLNSEQQRYEQASRQFTEARLRKDSGAAIPESEFENDRLTYFPQPGDDAANLAQKKRARETAMNGLRVASGNAYHQLYGVSPIDETVARLQGAGAGSNAASPADDAYAASLNLNK